MKIVLHGLKKEIAGQKIVDIDSFEFRSGKKTVIVGRNGCGKTTLFSMIAGFLEPDAGRVLREKGTLSLLEQDFPVRFAAATLFDVCADACVYLKAREEELKQLEERFAELSEHKRLRYAELRESFERDGGYDWRRWVQIVLEGLGFAVEDFSRDVVSFSGGQKRRALLARALLTHPEYLLLDEPSNHLDLDGILWLENWLAKRKATTLIISHDRHLIDAVADEIVEYKNASLTRYPAPFEVFRKERSKRLEAEYKQWKAQQEFIENTQDFIRRNIAGQKTKQAQSRRRMLEKVERLEAPMRDATWHLRLKKSKKESKELVSAKNLVCEYDGCKILGNISFTAYRGEKIAIVGANGCGKSTLIKVILGLEPVASGDLYVSSDASIGYFPQAPTYSASCLGRNVGTGGELNSENTVLDELFAENPGASEEEMRNILGGFLFSGDDVYKRIAVLSGGEKSRLLLAKLFLRRPNVLIMDEATNHLDLESRILLENALAEYDGSLIFVSHDRAFVNAIATSIWHIKDGSLERYEGNIDDNEKRLFASASGESKRADSKSDIRKTPCPGHGRPIIDRGANRFRVEKIENEIELLEKEIREAEARMISEESLRDGRFFAEIKHTYDVLQKQLEARYKEWEDLCG